MHVESVTLARRVAAVAPGPQDDPAGPSSRLESEAHTLATDWGRWCRSRRRLAPSDRLQSCLGRLVKIRATGTNDGPRVELSAECSAFNLAVATLDPVDRDVLIAFFALNVRPVKAVAAALQLSRATFYRHVVSAARQAYRLHSVILAEQRAIVAEAVE